MRTVLYIRISNLQANDWTVCKPVSACLKVNWWSVISQTNGDPTKLWRCPFNRISLEDFIKTIFFLACDQVPNPHCRQKIECLSVYSLSLSLSRWFYPWGCWKVKLNFSFWTSSRKEKETQKTLLSLLRRKTVCIAFYTLKV